MKPAEIMEPTPPVDRVAKVADLVRRFHDAPLGDPERLGSQLLDILLEIETAAKKADAKLKELIRK
jgi:hypothetical protein